MHEDGAHVMKVCKCADLEKAEVKQIEEVVSRARHRAQDEHIRKGIHETFKLKSRCNTEYEEI